MEVTWKRFDVTLMPFWLKCFQRLLNRGGFGSSRDDLLSRSVSCAIGDEARGFTIFEETPFMKCGNNGKRKE